YSWAIRSRLQPIKEAARTIKKHRDGILAWFDSRIANGLIESINSLVQAAKAKARGYRSLRNLVAITYLIAGKIDLRLPTRHSGVQIFWFYRPGEVDHAGGVLPSSNDRR